MNQTLLALCALGCISLYSIQSNRSSHHRQARALKAQIEAHAVEVGSDLLDQAASLPFDVPSAGPAASFAAADALSQWDGLSETVAVAASDDTLHFAVRAVVRPVERSGAEFAPGSAVSPFRQVALSIEGDLEVATSVERVYADLNR